MATGALPFARRVRDRMRARGLGLRELCRAAGLDPSFFSKVLSGKRSPPSDEAVLRRVALVLELDAPSLIASAGRLPEEWLGMLDDAPLFEAVHRLATGQVPPALPARAGAPGPAGAGGDREPAAEAGGGREPGEPSPGWRRWGRRGPFVPDGGSPVAPRRAETMGEELL